MLVREPTTDEIADLYSMLDGDFRIPVGDADWGRLEDLWLSEVDRCKTTDPALIAKEDQHFADVLSTLRARGLRTESPDVVHGFAEGAFLMWATLTSEQPFADALAYHTMLSVGALIRTMQLGLP